MCPDHLAAPYARQALPCPQRNVRTNLYNSDVEGSARRSPPWSEARVDGPLEEDAPLHVDRVVLVHHELIQDFRYRLALLLVHDLLPAHHVQQ